MKNIITMSILCAACSTASAIEIANTESIYKLSRSATNLMTFDTVDGVNYTRSFSSGPGISIDISTKSYSEIANILNNFDQGNTGAPPGLFENYPNLPTEVFALSEVERLLNGQELTDENYKNLIDGLLAEVRFTGVSIPLEYNLEENLSLEGSDENNIVFHSKFDEAYYICETSTFDIFSAPSNQVTSCSILSYDIDSAEGYFSNAVSYRSETLVTIKDESLYAYYNGLEYSLPVTGLTKKGYELASTSKPTIVPLENNDSNIYQLNNDGSVSIYSVAGMSPDDFHTFQMNDKYIVQFSNIEDSESFSSGYCEYELVENEVRCLSGSFSNLPFQPNAMTSDIKEFMGYTPFAKLGIQDEILAFYVGWTGTIGSQTTTPVLFELGSSEKKYLSTIRLDAIREFANNELVNEYLDFLTELITALDLYYDGQFLDSEMTGDLKNAVFNDYTAQLIVDKYLSDELDYSAKISSFENLLNSARYDSTYISENSIKTPLAKYSLQRDVKISGVITLPGDFKPAAGINITIVDNEGNITNTQSDANGEFTIINPTSDNYEITFSYPNHVFECANVDLSTGTFGDFEMLAGDLNNDGKINSADLWRFYFRTFYSSTDFDLNNDGAVNNADRDMIRANQGAVQCDL
jgi:hypothetical protein